MNSDTCCLTTVLLVNDIVQETKNKISRFFTVTIDPFRKSDKMIKFKSRNEYLGFRIINGTFKQKKIITWYYRNTDVPTYWSWKKYITRFKYIDVPQHILQLYDKEGFPVNKFFVIHKIMPEIVKYSYIDTDIGKLVTVEVPLGIASLVPERFMFNMEMYSAKKQP
jgi:uncharacterized protein (DUF3820 family)